MHLAHAKLWSENIAEIKTLVKLSTCIYTPSLESTGQRLICCQMLVYITLQSLPNVTCPLLAIQVGDDEKIDSLQLEVGAATSLLASNEGLLRKSLLLPLQYTYLLTSQLESQRLFFEEKLARVEKEANEQVSS